MNNNFWFYRNAHNLSYENEVFSMSNELSNFSRSWKYYLYKNFPEQSIIKSMFQTFINNSKENLMEIHDASENLYYSFIQESLVKNNQNLYKFFTKRNENKQVKVYTLIKLLNFFNEAELLSNYHTNSDFWARLDGGNFLEKIGYRFYLYHSFVHNKRISSPHMIGANYENLYGDGECGERGTNLILKTRKIINNIVEELSKILDDGDNEECIVSFYKEYAELKEMDLNDFTYWISSASGNTDDRGFIERILKKEIQKDCPDWEM